MTTQAAARPTWTTDEMDLYHSIVYPGPYAGVRGVTVASYQIEQSYPVMRGLSVTADRVHANGVRETRQRLVPADAIPAWFMTGCETDRQIWAILQLWGPEAGS